LPHDLIVDYINKEYPNASSIKVPFSKYLLPKKDWWKAASHEQIEVPIGKFGSDIQSIKITTLDTNGIMLIGTTGSGKSNLLHVIITNAICKYAPDQLELYLIDFKGGVEFPPYADNYIPHIRAIAITSERDFGLSVLEKVEKEMLDRQRKWNTLSIRDIIGFHSSFPNESMPRILLIVDEFQLFFTEDDEIKKKAEMILNNLLKQGRAFGINILFSSQTLTGQNNIHPSIKDQFEIRIALKCLDADVDKIFEEKNKAPKDLLGKGDGIYNDKKGMAIYNKKFQAFYVEDNRDDLKEFLKEIESYSMSLGNKFIDKPHIVFRSSAKALLEKSSLAKYVQSKNPISSTSHLWLGQPISIDDDVRAVLKRQSGGNMLIVGSDVEVAVRILFSSITSLFSQNIRSDTSFYFFNFFDTDTEEYKNLNKPFQAVRNKFNVEIVDEKSIKLNLEIIKKELDVRLTSAVSSYPKIFVIITSLQRGRIFNKDNNNLSDEAKILSSIIKDGSNKDIHTIIQIDSMDSFMDRIFDRDKLLSEFSQRVATQMNEDNSRKLLRSKDAMLLGNNRAYYYWDTENKLVKFKPFELPTTDFFKSIITKIPNK
jgi:S-DNA-T family DNA segregation ATPase FtsK/SpoIIIE